MSVDPPDVSAPSFSTVLHNHVLNAFFQISMELHSDNAYQAQIIMMILTAA
jgi:hypothetical protein